GVGAGITAASAVPATQCVSNDPARYVRMSSALGDVLATLELERVDQWLFVGQQLPAPANHILGGHISAQALLAASHTAPGRAPHSVHTYFLRSGDSRRPVDFEVVDLQEGRTFSARRVTARQDGTILMEAMSSFKVADSHPLRWSTNRPCRRLPVQNRCRGLRRTWRSPTRAPKGGGRACAGSSAGSSTPRSLHPHGR